MIHFQIELAKLHIKVSCHYDYTQRFCRDYLSEGKADYSVTVSEREIDEEIAVCGFQPQRGYAESICVYRAIARKLPLFQRLIFHGAVVSYHGRGYLFTAPSGTGKTTHIRLWQQYLPGVEIVNGDKPILALEDEKVVAFATPYAGKEGYQNHGNTQIDAICLLHRGQENRIRRVSSGEILTELMRQVYLPQEAQAAIKTLELLDKLYRTVPLYLLECDMSEEAVKTSFETLSGEKYEDQVKK